MVKSLFEKAKKLYKQITKEDQHIDSYIESVMMRVEIKAQRGYSSAAFGWRPDLNADDRNRIITILRDKGFRVIHNYKHLSVRW